MAATETSLSVSGSATPLSSPHRRTKSAMQSSSVEDSSDSEGDDVESSSSKAFHRRVSTSKQIKHKACIKEGYLMKQTSSFQRWRRRYFKIKGRNLYYAKESCFILLEAQFPIKIVDQAHGGRISLRLGIPTQGSPQFDDGHRVESDLSEIFEEVDLTDVSVAENSTKNVNNSFRS
ncbi:diacylglycerol kinase eta-like [Diadema antillarum]|uniref:diacylglycerol kinase eta-like n=1 Tax=Diadema antillarum TaxID=105358 RepID=UPI003A838E5E